MIIAFVKNYKICIAHDSVACVVDPQAKFGVKRFGGVHTPSFSLFEIGFNHSNGWVFQFSNETVFEAQVLGEELSKFICVLWRLVDVFPAGEVGAHIFIFAVGDEQGSVHCNVHVLDVGRFFRKRRVESKCSY